MKKRVISFVLTICMALAMMPAMSITASAAPTPYDIWVGGVQVTSDNSNDITGAGISAGTVSYNHDTKTLTLSGAAITGAQSMSAGGLEAYVGIYATPELTIEIRGNCSITPTTIAKNSCGIYAGGLSGNKLTLSGDGTLFVKGADVTATGAFSYGIYSTGNVTVSGPAVTAIGGTSATRGSAGIYIYGYDGKNLTVSGGEVTATGGNSKSYSYGIYAGTLSISGETTVTATGGSSSLSGYGSYGISAPFSDSSISGGTVIATGGNVETESYGIYTGSYTLSITGGTVTAKGGQNAMSTPPAIDGYPGAVTLTGASESPAQVVAAYTNEKYAKFGAMTTYSVTYDGNGGSGSMTGGTAAAITAFPLPASAFTPPAGKTFYKWAVDSTEGTQVAANGIYTFTDDTTVYALWKPPVPTTLDMITASDSGPSATDNITNDNSPTFSGTAQPNSSITLKSNGTNIIGTGTADGSGNWTITASTLADGNHTITAIASDSGISSDPSSGLSITIDTAAPSGYIVSIDQAAINEANKTAMSFTFSGAEASATYHYMVSSSGGGTAVNGSGTIVNANDRITGIDLSGLGDGTVTLSANLKDAAGNQGLAATDTVSKNTAAPTVSSLSPANNATGTSVNANMVITFNEAVTAAAGKKITIKAVSGDSTVETVDAADAKVTGSGTATITVNPAVTLASSTGYYIQIEAGAFKNFQNNGYAGIADTTSWRFTTSDTSSPPTYTISTDTTPFDFGSLTAGYGSAPAAQTITITNTGNQTITLTEPSTTNASSNYNIGSLSRTVLGVSETATFTIQPKIGLTVGTYNETINITGSNSASASVLAQFRVTSAGGSGGGGGSSTPTLITKIESGGNVTGTNVDKLVAEKKSLTVEGKAGEKLVLDTEALKNIDGQTKDNIKVEIKDVSKEHKSEHPDKLVVSLKITAGGKYITNFGKGTATVSLPYDLKAGEKAKDVTVWYLAEDGTMTELPCTYDASTKLATFKVNHFSLYVVGTADTSKWTNPFSDVKESSWYYDAVRYVSANKLMNGTSDTAFNPGAKTTRGMIVAILWRMENEPKASKDMTFADVKNGMYYHDAVAWASEKGIVGGYSAEQFGPENDITREQLAEILYNYAANKGYNIVLPGGASGAASGDLPANLSAFSDAGKIHSWGKEALSWANAEGLINGTGSNLLDPAGAAQRSQVAAILQRFVENIMK